MINNNDIDNKRKCNKLSISHRFDKNNITYYELINLLKQVFLNHPFVNNFYTNRYATNNNSDVEYPAIIVTTDSINVGLQTTTVNLTILYIDRLTELEDNVEYVLSLGIQVINECINAILNRFSLIDMNNTLSFKVFKNLFADRCSGVVSTISLTFPSLVGECDYLDVCFDCC